MLKKAALLGSVTFWGALVSAAYGLSKIFLSRRELAPGVCPVEDYRGFFCLAIFLGVCSILLDFIQSRVEKSALQKQDHDQK